MVARLFGRDGTGECQDEAFRQSAWDEKGNAAAVSLSLYYMPAVFRTGGSGQIEVMKPGGLGRRTVDLAAQFRRR